MHYSAVTISHKTHACSICSQLTLNNKQILTLRRRWTVPLVTGWSANCTHQLLTNFLHEMIANQVNSIGIKLAKLS